MFSLEIEPFAWKFDPGPWQIEAFKRAGGETSSMSQATKIVLGTIGVSAVLALAIIFALAFG